MQRARATEFPEIAEIRQDLDSLKTNVVELSRHLKAEGRDQASKISDIALERLEKLRKSALDEYHKAEEQVKAHPGQSVAAAFAAGMVLSLLLRGK